MANATIRARAKEKGVCLWEIADRFGIMDTNFSKKLRKEFAPADTEKALRFIDEIAAERENDGIEH